MVIIISYSLEILGREGHEYIIEVEGKRKTFQPGEKIKVKSKEDADRLSELKDTDGKLLFKLNGGAKDARNSEDSK